MRKVRIHPSLASKTGNSLGMDRRDLILGFGGICPVCGIIHRRDLIHVLKGFLLGDISYSYYSQSLQKCVETLNPEAVYVHHPYMYRNVPSGMIYDLHMEVMESLIFEKLATSSLKYRVFSFFGNIFKKSDLLAGLSARNVYTYSDIEYQILLKQGVNIFKVDFVPTTSPLPMRQSKREEIKRIGLYGNFNWPPNIVMFDELVRRKSDYSDVIFVLTERVLQHKNLIDKLERAEINFQIIDDLDEDSFLKTVDAIWCVTSIGGGVRTKLINALNSGVPAFVNDVATRDNKAELSKYKEALIYVD